MRIILTFSILVAYSLSTPYNVIITGLNDNVSFFSYSQCSDRFASLTTYLHNLTHTYSVCLKVGTYFLGSWGSLWA